MKIALVVSSKAGMESSLSDHPGRRQREEEEPPPDLFAECDSDETIDAVAEVLREKHEVVVIESDEKAYGRLKRGKPHLVFNMSERLFGPNRESHIPTVCEILGIPYTGSDPMTLGLCLDKSRAKEVLSYHKIPNPAFWTVAGTEDIPAGVCLPAIVKPLYEGSSKGIKNNSVVRSASELHERVGEVVARYGQPAIVEKFLGGREFTVGILGTSPELEILPIVEIDHSRLPSDAVPIYSYEAKWVWDRPDEPLEIFRCPADVSKDLKRRIERIITRTCSVLRIRDWCRIDMRLDDKGEPNILEINPLPGVLPRPEDNSCLPKAARTAGYTYSQLLHRVVAEASKRYGLRPSRVQPPAEPPAVSLNR